MSAALRERVWKKQLQQIARADIPSVEFQTFRHRWATASEPVRATCVAADGAERNYVIKGKYDQIRQFCNEQIVALCGRLVGAPVAALAEATVTDADKAGEPRIAHLVVDPCHAVEYVPYTTERDDNVLKHTDLAQNRARYAALEVLYSWMGCGGDHQFFYDDEPPQLVYSFDHGLFFPQNGNWTSATLDPNQFVAIDPYFVAAHLVSDERQGPVDRLRRVRPVEICRVVASPPPSWGLTDDDRYAMCTYLVTRRRVVLDAYGAIL